MDNLKICITTLEFPPDVGGVGESVKRIGKLLASLGHEIHVVVFHTRRSSTTRSETGRKGFHTTIEEQLHVHRYESVSRTGSASTQDFMSDVYAALRRLHEQERFDVFHGFYVNETGFVTTLLAREVGRPAINSIRGADLHRNVFDTKQFGQIHWVLEQSDWLTFVSQELEQRAHILAPSVRNRTAAFWNSIAPIDFDTIDRPEPDVELAGTVISTFGNLRDKKGIDFLVWACAELAPRIDLTLLLVGDFIEKEKAHWQEFIRASGIAERIVVTGRLPREQALGYHHLTDIFVIPSLRDGCPNALIEAMLAGKAIVGSSADAIGEILEHEQDALVVRPANTADLIENLERLATDKPLQQRLGEAARRKALRDLSPERERDNWLSVYEQVLAPAGTRVIDFSNRRTS
ncbi:MAG: glycosyltransferase [Betaproteobacteria bacterium]|nr:MAG: glycosyltransferase [Betaproteobacteria bacterium]